MSFKSVILAMFSLLLFCLLGCAGSPTVDHFKGLQGDWELVSFHKHGRIVGADAIKQLTVSIRQDRFQMLEKKPGTNPQEFEISIAEEFVLQLDSSKSPAEMQLVFPTGEKQGQLRRAIYVLEGNELKICAAEIGKATPTEFIANEKAAWSLYVLNRNEGTGKRKSL